MNRNAVADVGMYIGVALIVKSAIQIAATEVVFSFLEFITKMIWDPAFVVNAEKGLEELFFAESALTFSLGAMYVFAGLTNNSSFFIGPFFVFNITSIVLRAILLGTGNAVSIHHYFHIAEVSAVVVLMAAGVGASAIGYKSSKSD